MSDSGAPLARTTIGPYRVVRELGRGGMGVVYEVENPQLKKRFALKSLHISEQLSPELVARFRREAEALARIDRHPGIVSVFDVGREDNLLYFTMDLIGGGDLDDLLSTADVPVRQAAALAAGIADALEHAHRHGIIHRDLKPANVLLSSDGTPKLTDFGLAHDTSRETRLTTSGVAMGTPVYMSPEQASGKTSQIDARTDVYAAGAVLYELLTNAPPFNGESSASVIMQVIAQEPRRPRAANPLVPRELEAICVRAMEKEPAKRYPSAAALRDDLRNWLDGRPVTAKSIGRVGYAWRRAKRNPVALVAAGVAAVAVGGSAAWGVATWTQAASATTAREQRAAGALPLIKEGDRLAAQAERYKYIQGIALREIESTLQGADAHYTEALAIDDASATVWLARGRVREQQMRLDESLADFDQAIHLQPELGAAYLERANLLSTLTANQRPLNVNGRAMDSQGRFSGAFRTSRTLVREHYEPYAARTRADLAAAARLGIADAELARARAMLAFAVSEDPEYLAALQLHDAAVAADATDVDARVDRVRTLYAAHRFGEAADEARATVAMAPNYYWSQQVYANALYYQQDWTAAIEAFRRALTYTPNSFTMRRDLAHALMEHGRFDAAHATFEEAAALDDADPMPLHGMCLMVLGRYAEAEAIFRAALAAPLYAAVARQGLAVLLLRMERGREALPLFDALLADEPGDTVNLGMRALAHRQLGDHAAAEADFRRSLAADPNNVTTLQNYGVFCSNRQRPAEALALGTQAVALRPELASLWRNLGEFHRESKQFPDAIAAFEQALKLEPGHAATQTALARVLLAAGDAQRALDLLIAADRAHPNRAETLRFLGRAQFELGDAAGARATLDAAIAAHEGYAPAYVIRGLVRAQSGDVPGGLGDFKRAAELDPTLPEAHSNRANAARSLDDLAEFSSAASDWIAAHPQAPAAHANMGLLHFMQREYPQAAAKFADAVRLGAGDMEIWYRKSMGDALHKAGDFAAAVDAYAGALAIDPTFLQALVPKGIAELEAGRPKAALATFAQAYAREDSTREFLQPYADRAAAALEGAGGK